MLTEQERKWLEERKNRPALCGGPLNYCGYGCLVRYGCPLTPDYQDVAEFEARVQRKLMYQYEKAYHCKDVGRFMPNRDTMLMYALLAVEQEMDNERNHA